MRNSVIAAVANEAPDYPANRILGICQTAVSGKSDRGKSPQNAAWEGAEGVADLLPGSILAGARGLLATTNSTQAVDGHPAHNGGGDDEDDVGRQVAAEWHSRGDVRDRREDHANGNGQ